jgi:hypothetical protein
MREGKRDDMLVKIVPEEFPRCQDKQRAPRCGTPTALMSVVNSQDEWCQPLLPAEGGRFVVAHGWGRDLLDVGDKL